MTFKVLDAVTLGDKSINDHGYLITEAFAFRTGIQIYTGDECGLIDRDVVRVMRLEDEVKSPESLKTLSHIPVTMDHPSEPVTADNWADLAKGEVSTSARWENGKIALPLIVKDRATIDAIQNGIRELSAGYTCDLDFDSPGVHNGEQYDAVQRNIRFNHLAVVKHGRAGSECRITDGASNWGESPAPKTTEKDVNDMTDNLTSVVLGDKAVNVSPADAAHIDAFKTSMVKQLADKDDEKKAMSAKHEKEVGEKDAEIDKLKKDAMTSDKLDALIADRSQLIADAKTVFADLDPKGMTDADIRKAVVVNAYDESVVKDRGDEYVTARFDALVSDAAETNDADGDQFTKVVKGDTALTKDAQAMLDTAYTERNTALNDAWKTPKKGA